MASGDLSTAMGFYTTASGYASTAMGYQTKASDNSSLVVGRNNLAGSTVTASATEFSLDNTAFVIGNGLNANNKSDALVVKFNGDATLAGSMTATSFIGDGSQLTNLPSSGGDSPLVITVMKQGVLRLLITLQRVGLILQLWVQEQLQVEFSQQQWELTRKQVETDSQQWDILQQQVELNSNGI